MEELIWWGIVFRNFLLQQYNAFCGTGACKRVRNWST